MSENETTTAEETAVTTLARFEVPSRLEKIEDPNDANHLTFVAEPFENGYGHTLGNSLRRVLLGSLEGAAITSVRIAGAQHEFFLPARCGGRCDGNRAEPEKGQIQA